MPHKNLFITLFIILFTFSCKKEEMLHPPSSTWEDTQKVRVLKVVILDEMYNFIYDTIEYNYNTSGKLDNIVTKTQYIYEQQTHPISYTEHTSILYNLVGCSGWELVRHYSNFIIKNNRIHNVYDKHNFSRIFCTKQDYGLVDRNSIFYYDNNGYLNKISSNFSSDEYDEYYGPKTGTDMSIHLYSGNEIKKIQVVNYIRGEEMENYFVEPNYENNTDIPDGLRRMVNQALLGLNSIGFEEFMNVPDYLLPLNFLDWWVSFGFPEMQVIPSQNAGLVTSKQLKGKIFQDIVMGEYHFIDVDSTIYYPYVHDATAKTLEIAGLKIWYELVK